jgi:predicted transcriptional regulator of viral defense system
MKFSQLLEIVGEEPLFETGLLLTGDVDPNDVRRQLSRWAKAGKIYQLRRGLYTLAPPYNKIDPHPFLIANQMARGSYVSCQSALAYYGLIPEYVPVTISVTGDRPARRKTPSSVFEFHHVKPDLLFGYLRTEVGPGQEAFIARPEKALIDLVYLQPGGDLPAYLKELRLQNLEQIDLAELERQAGITGRPKLRRAAAVIADLGRAEREEYEVL